MSSEDRALLIKVPAIVSLVVGPVIIITRLWTRLAMTKFFGIDDWMILGSMISSILMSAMLLNAVHYGYGMHDFDIIPKQNVATALRYYWYMQTFYKITLNVTKISILLLYLRIFPQRWLRIGCYLILTLVVTYGLVSVFYSSVFQCTPVSKAYQKSLPGHCINVRKTWQANAGFNIASDLMILVLPMPALHSLQMSSKPKLGLIFLFGLGSFVLVVSCLRAALLKDSIDPDLTYNSVIIIEWSIIETNVGIICACIPVIHRPLAILMVKVWSISKKKSRTAPFLKRSDQDLHMALAPQDTHWLSLEPLEASRPTRMTNVLTRPRAQSGDDVESLNYSRFIKKTTDISVQYDRPQPSPTIKI